MATTMATKAFAYLRVSGKGQVEGDGLPRQLADIKAYAKAHGIQIVRVYEEKGVCGATEWEERPAWSDMIQNLNGVRTIIIERLNRLARELFIQEYILRDLKQRGITLVSVADEDIDSSPERVLFRQIMGAISQYDKTMIVMKLRAARKRMKAATGRCEGRKPYGTRDGEAAVIQRMRQLRSSGMAFRDIAAALNSDGIETRTPGKRWRGYTINSILRRHGVS
jgi:DNA invertase Pin-like site-specific DNA recombinase